MGKIMSLKFEYVGQDNYCNLCVEKSDLTRYTFRIKSEELEALLPEENYFIEKNGHIEVSASSEDLKSSKLKLSIAHAIADYFKLN